MRIQHICESNVWQTDAPLQVIHECMRTAGRQCSPKSFHINSSFAAPNSDAFSLQLFFLFFFVVVEFSVCICGIRCGLSHRTKFMIHIFIPHFSNRRTICGCNKIYSRTRRPFIAWAMVNARILSLILNQIRFSLHNQKWYRAKLTQCVPKMIMHLMVFGITLKNTYRWNNE